MYYEQRMKNKSLLGSNLTEQDPVSGSNCPSLHVSVLRVLSDKHTMYLFGWFGNGWFPSGMP